jgi:transcription initiation factor TFIIB
MINKNTRTREADEQASAERSTAERVEETCPECEGTVVTDEEHGERVCSDCGLVVETDSIDRGPEWRAFDSAERDNKSRVGAPTTTMMHDKGLSTNIGWQDKDAYGKTLSSRQRRQMQRLRTWNERFRTRDSKDGERTRSPRERPRDCERHLPAGPRRGPPPRSLH